MIGQVCVTVTSFALFIAYALSLSDIPLAARFSWEMRGSGGFAVAGDSSTTETVQVKCTKQ